MLFSLLLTGLLATTPALASDDSSGATKTVVLASVPSLLRAPVLQGSRFVVSGQRPAVLVNGYQVRQQQPEQAPVRTAVTSQTSEGPAEAVVHQQEVPQQEQSAAGLSQHAVYSDYPQYFDYSHRRYVPSYVYSPPYVYPPFSGAVHQHPFLPAQPQSPVIELNALSPPVQILVRTPSGVQVFRPVPYSRQPVHYFVGVFPTVSEQEQSSTQPAAQEQTLVTKVTVPIRAQVANETQSSPEAVSLASSTSVTEPVHTSSTSTANETKVGYSSDSF